MLYAVVGLLAIQIPLGLGGEATDREGALQAIAREPFGEALLVVLAVGLAGFALWRLAQALIARQDEGGGRPNLAKRVGYLGLALFYVATAAYAVSIVAGARSSGPNEKQETAVVLDWPLGRYIVAGVGVAFLVGGVFNGYRSVTTKFREQLKEHELGTAAKGWAIAVGVLGHAARAVVFSLLGVFLLRAAIQYDPKEAVGLDGALQKIAQQPYGGVLLGLVAAGFLAYALFCAVQARYADV